MFDLQAVTNAVFPAGVGVDMVDIEAFQRLYDTIGQPFLTQTFSARELAQTGGAANFLEQLAGRFAAKEAVFKALAPLAADARFDFRQLEILKNSDGSPYVCANACFQRVAGRAAVSAVHLSISHEAPYAIAFAVAERPVHATGQKSDHI